jgi:hypothetical protein
MDITPDGLTAGRYEEAMRWVDQTILEQPRYTPTLWMKVVLCELMGRHNEASEALKPLLGAWPGFTIEAFAAYAKHHYTPRLRDHLCRGIAQGWPA